MGDHRTGIVGATVMNEITGKAVCEEITQCWPI